LKSLIRHIVNKMKEEFKSYDSEKDYAIIKLKRLLRFKKH